MYRHLFIIVIVFSIFAYAGDDNLDLSFNGNGKVVTNISGTDDDVGYGIAIQSDGKIVAAGSSSGNFALVRYESDGSLDTSFSDKGIVTSQTSGDQEFRSVAIQSDGKIIVAGKTSLLSTFFALFRYNSNGSLDTSFNVDGRVFTDMGKNESAQSVAIQKDGKIVVAGYSTINNSVDFALVRYESNGSLDSEFGTDGKVFTDMDAGAKDKAYGVAIDSDGKIVVAGYIERTNGDTDFAMVRYNSNGTLDHSFGENNTGKVITKIQDNGTDWYDYAYSVAIQSDNKIVIAGQSGYGPVDNFALLRYNKNGTLDTSFGANHNGIVIVSAGGYGDTARSVTIQSDGKIIAGGESYDGQSFDFALVRLNADGTLDTSFGRNGKVTTGIMNGDAAQCIAIQRDGKVVALGYTDNGFNKDFALVRYRIFMTLAPIYYLLQ